MKISVVLPAHNEEKNISLIVPNLINSYPKDINEIIIVNDNSTDKTEEVSLKLIKKYGNKIKLINREKPNGVGYTIRDGVNSVAKSSNWVLSMDSDFLDNIGDIQRFIDKTKKGCDGVIGSRFLRKQSLINYPLLKMISNRMYHFLLHSILGIRQRDITNNFKLYKKEIFETIKLKSANFAVNAETGLLPIIHGYKIAEVPVIWKERDFGKSKFVVFKLAPSYLKVFFRVFKKKSLNKS